MCIIALMHIGTWLHRNNVVTSYGSPINNLTAHSPIVTSVEVCGSDIISTSFIN